MTSIFCDTTIDINDAGFVQSKIWAEKGGGHIYAGCDNQDCWYCPRLPESVTLDRHPVMCTLLKSIAFLRKALAMVVSRVNLRTGMDIPNQPHKWLPVESGLICRIGDLWLSTSTIHKYVNIAFPGISVAIIEDDPGQTIYLPSCPRSGHHLWQMGWYSDTTSRSNKSSSSTSFKLSYLGRTQMARTLEPSSSPERNPILYNDNGDIMGGQYTRVH